MGTIHNLQILRAFAAINVAILHLIATASAYGFEPIYVGILKGWGNNGVDIFFVLSGFIILHTQLQKKRTLFEFLKLRIIRIVPIYWFISLALIFCYLVFPTSFFNSQMPSIELILKSLFFVSGINSGASVPIVGVGWTLELEMLFYLIFGLSLFFTQWNKSYIFVLLFLLIFAMTTSKIILIEFLFGMFIAIVFNSLQLQNRYGLLIASIGFLLLLTSINNINNLYLNRVIIWGIPSSMIIFGLIYAKQCDQRLLKYLGDASYSIYLVHAFLISAFYKLITLLSISCDYDILALICLTLTVTFGSAIYSFVEKPLTGLIRSKLS